MPTGYTYKIKDGISFQEYALICARAFGALIDMRDEPLGAEIPQNFVPSDYHLKESKSIKKELETFNSLTDDEILQNIDTEYNEESKSLKKSIRENQDLKQKYEKLLAQATAYVPPTPDHVNFKNFMVNQLKESMKFDCSRDYFENKLKRLSKPTIEEWKQNKLESITSNIEYHTKQYEKDVENCKRKNEWIDKLRKSIAVDSFKMKN